MHRFRSLPHPGINGMHVVVVLMVVMAASAAPTPLVQLDAWGTDSVRVRIAPSGGSIVDPPLSPLLIPHPSQPKGPSSSLGLTNGNLEVSSDPTTGFVTATRVSDGAVLLKTQSITFGEPAANSRSGYVSGSLVYTIADGNKVYGLGEHRTGSLDMTGYSKLFSTSQLYSDSHGSDVLMPFVMVYPLGVGFVWNLPSYGAVNLSTNGKIQTVFMTARVRLSSVQLC